MRADYHQRTDDDEDVLKWDELQCQCSQKRSDDKGKRTADAEKTYSVGFFFVYMFEEIAFCGNFHKARPDTGDKQNDCPYPETFYRKKAYKYCG